MSGLATIQAFGWQERLQSSTYNLLDLSQSPFYLLYCIQLWVNLVLNLIVAGLAVVLVALTVTLTEKTNAGFVGVALVTIMNFNMSLANLIKYWTMLETSMGAIARIKCFVGDVTPESEPVVPVELDPCWPQQGRIDISNLSVSYGYVSHQCGSRAIDTDVSKREDLTCIAERVTSCEARREDRYLWSFGKVRTR